MGEASCYVGLHGFHAVRLALAESRSPFFVIVDTEAGDFKASENPGASAKDAACVDAVEFLVAKGVKAVLTGNVGHNALVTRQDTPIRIYLGVSGTVRNALEEFKKKKLSRAKEPSVGFMEGLKKGDEKG